MQTKTIMVVDDSYVLLKTVKEALESSGFHVITAQSGEEALRKLKEAKVDLALLDIIMPSMSGLDLTTKIKEDKKFKNLKIAFLTILNFTENQKKSLKKYNILDYIQKPFDNEDLIRRIKKMVA